MAPSPEGIDDFWLVLHVRLREPRIVEADNHEPEPTTIVGFYRTFGIRCAADRVPALIEQAAAGEGHILWDTTEWHAIDPSTLDPAVRKRVLPVVGEGIWYTGGRIFYPDDGTPEANPQEATPGPVMTSEASLADVVALARRYLAGELTFEQFCLSAPEGPSDEDVAEILDLIEHEPKVGGFLGISKAAHAEHLAKIHQAIQRVERRLAART